MFVSRVTPNGVTPPVTILKPIYGLDKGLEENLRSFCVQDYPELLAGADVHVRLRGPEGQHPDYTRL